MKYRMTAEQSQVQIEKEAIIHEIVGAIRQLNRAVYHDAREMNRHFGLTVPQSGALRVLARHGRLSSVELSRKLFVTPSNITGIIDRLEKKGFVKRVQKKGDRRIMLISLTRTGVEVGKSLPDPTEKKLILGLADLSTREIRELQQAVNRILLLMDADKASDTLENTPRDTPRDTMDELG